MTTASLNNLRLSRAADREKIATALTALAVSYGAEVERFAIEREIHLTITLKGVRACIGIDGDSRLGLPLISWVAPSGVGQCFSSAFNVCVGNWTSGGVPHHKATSCPDDLDGLLLDLEEGLAIVSEDLALQFYIHPWAADTAWVGAGSPEPKAAWVEHYRATGEELSVAPWVQAKRAEREAFLASFDDREAA